MTDVAWDSLCRRSFGEIIFSNIPFGRKGLPEMIAAGDLDGDLCFVCWDDAIVAHVQPCNDAEDVVAEESKAEAEGRRLGDDWLLRAQGWRAEGQAVKAYRMAIDHGKHGDGDRKPDVKAYFVAYRMSLCLSVSLSLSVCVCVCVRVLLLQWVYICVHLCTNAHRCVYKPFQLTCARIRGLRCSRWPA